MARSSATSACPSARYDPAGHYAVHVARRQTPFRKEIRLEGVDLDKRAQQEGMSRHQLLNNWLAAVSIMGELTVEEVTAVVER